MLCRTLRKLQEEELGDEPEEEEEDESSHENNHRTGFNAFNVLMGAGSCSESDVVESDDIESARVGADSPQHSLPQKGRKYQKKKVEARSSEDNLEPGVKEIETNVG